MATPVFCCGFECGVLLATPTAHWLLVGTASISTSTVRSGSRSLRCNPTAATGGAQTVGIINLARWIGRCYVNFATLPNADCTVATYGNSQTGPNVRFKQSDSKIYAAVGTTFGATGVSVTTGQWYRLDCDFNVNTAGADFCDVQVDGTACGQATGTGSSAATTVFTAGVVTGPVTADFYIDDVILSNTAADYPIGAGYINHFVPTADGTHNIAGTADFTRTATGTDILNATTTAYQLVDDVPLETGASVDWIAMVGPPNATDYVECIFGPASGISTPTVGPRAVEVIAGVHQASTQTGNMEIRINDNGTMNAMYSATTATGVVTITYKRKHYAVNIANGGAWTAVSGAGNFNNLRVRFGSPAAVDVVPNQFFDCIMLEAEFSGSLIPPTSLVMPVKHPQFYSQRKVI